MLIHYPKIIFSLSLLVSPMYPLNSQTPLEPVVIIARSTTLMSQAVGRGTTTPTPTTATPTAAGSPAIIAPTTPVVRGTVSGVVTDADGQPIADALIKITTRTPSATTSTSLAPSTFYIRTSGKGQFTIDSLRAGEQYSVSVLKIGYKPVVSGRFLLSANATHYLNFRMAGIDPLP